MAITTYQKTSNAIFLLSVVAATDITRGIAITQNGQIHGGAHMDYIGIARGAVSSGDPVEYEVIGEVVCCSGAAIAVGAKLGLDATGRVITWTTGQIVGRALEAVSAADEEIRVLLGNFAT